MTQRNAKCSQPLEYSKVTHQSKDTCLSMEHVDAYAMVHILSRYACCSNSATCASAAREGLTSTFLLQRQAVNSCRPFTGGPVTLRQQKHRRSSPQSLQARAGLLSFFRPTKQSTNKRQAAELVTKVLHTASQTNSGATASEEQCKEIKQLVRNTPRVSANTPTLYNN